MTTDNVKQPPDTDRLVLVVYRLGGWGTARWFGDAGWSKPGIDDNAEWRECIPWDRLAILDRYDEEREEWERQVDGLGEDLEHTRRRLDSEINNAIALRSQVTALTKERDRFMREYSLSSTNAANEKTRADRAEKERDKWHAIYTETAVERDHVIAERDDLGCQLEALRAVQRDDVADLRMRMEAVEKWRAETQADIEQAASISAAMVDPREAKEARDRWQAVVDDKGGA